MNVDYEHGVNQEHVRRSIDFCVVWEAHMETSIHLPLPWSLRLPKMYYRRVWVPEGENQWRPSWIFRKGKVLQNASWDFTEKPKTKPIFLIYSVAKNIFFPIFVCWNFPSHLVCPFFFFSKIEKQFLSFLEDVRNLVVLMTQKAYSIHVRPGEKMASWWCPQRKPAPTESPL